MKKAIIILFCIGISACGTNDKKTTILQKEFKVEKTTLKKTLFFTGTIEPIRQTPIIVKDNAVVEKIYTNYGQFVKKGEQLARVNSLSLRKDVNNALTSFLKAKDSFNVAKSKFIGTKKLWDAGLIAKNNYLSEKSSLATSEMTLIQEQDKLSHLVANRLKTGISLEQLAKLRLDDIEKVKKILKVDFNLITLNAPISGVVLMPPKSGNDSVSDITVGSQLKEGQVISLIGNMTGIAVNIKVPEVNIDKVKNGQKAIVKGIAFPKFPLHGNVIEVASQASTTAGASGGFPLFEAKVEVPKLSVKQASLVKVGMSAHVEVDIESKSVLMIPIKAVFQESGLSKVKLKKDDGKIVTKAITTGESSVDKVVVESGLKQGDVIVYG
jgi:HlyD family secretion protein